MNKIGKLINLKNQKVNIYNVDYEVSNIKDGSRDKCKALSFGIEGIYDDEVFNFSFDLNCKSEKLLNFEDCKTFDFTDYIDASETMITINKITYMDIKFNAKIHRWQNNEFKITIYFFLEEEKPYSGILEIDFNLDEYL